MTLKKIHQEHAPPWHIFSQAEWIRLAINVP